MRTPPSGPHDRWLTTPVGLVLRAVLLVALTALIAVAFTRPDTGVRVGAVAVLVLMWVVNLAGLIRRTRATLRR